VNRYSICLIKTLLCFIILSNYFTGESFAFKTYCYHEPEKKFCPHSRWEGSSPEIPIVFYKKSVDMVNDNSPDVMHPDIFYLTLRFVIDKWYTEGRANFTTNYDYNNTLGSWKKKLMPYGQISVIGHH
jgi:hypothetical protein